MDLITFVSKPADTDADTELSAYIFRIEHDKRLGRTVHVRMLGGRLSVRDEITLNGSDKAEKITQIKIYDGVKLTDAHEMENGNIGVLCGLKEGGIGGIYGSAKRGVKNFRISRPLIKAKVIPDDGDYQKLVKAAKILNDEDPLLDMEWIKDQRELLLSVTGLIQMEILERIYRTRFGINASFDEPTVIYMETPRSSAEGFEAYTMPKPCWAIIRLLIEPLPPGSGVVYESAVGPDTVPYRYQSQIEQAIPGALRQGPKGWEVTDIKITLTGGESHVYHTHPLDFIVATPMALMNGLVNSGTDLLEPYIRFSITAPEIYAPKLLGEITRIRGSYDDTRIVNGDFTVSGIYPLASGMDLPKKLAMMTAGGGRMSSRFSHYAKCPEGFTVTRAYRGVSPLDRAKYILHIRHAL
jgi:ribosomal protection tetracycline resistance protein